MKFLNADTTKLRKASLALGIMFALGSSSALANGMSPVDDNRGDNKKVENKEFSTLDRDGNNRISKDEYYRHVNNNERYRGWDRNRDNRVDENEWNNQDRDEDFNSWDTNRDGSLDNYELNEGSFSNYDQNNDNYLDEDEWDEAGDDGWFDDWF